MSFFGASQCLIPVCFDGILVYIYISGCSDGLVFNIYAGSIKNLDRLYISIEFFG